MEQNNCNVTVSSDLKFRGCECRWTIPNFRSRYEQYLNSGERDFILSPVLAVDRFEWILDLPPLECPNDYLSLRINQCYKGTENQLRPNNNDDFQFRLSISIVNNEGEKAFSTKPHAFTKEQLEKKIAVFKNIVANSSLLAENSRLLRNDKLTLSCKIIVIENVSIDSHDITKNAVLDQLDKRRLLELSGFEKLLEDGNFSDLDIVVGGKTFQAHKAILSARSSVFAAMLGHEMMEKQKSKIEIFDFEADVVEQMLHFVYSGVIKIEKIERFAVELFEIGDKYDLPGLKPICEQVLIKNLSTDNIIQILRFVDLHDGPQLLCAAVFEILRKKRRSFAEMGEDLERIFSSLSSGFLAKVIRSFMDTL